MTKFAIAALLFLCAMSAAQADPQQLSPELKAFLHRPDQQQTILQIMARQWQGIVENCPSPTFAITGVLPEQDPAFDPNGTPVSGRWRAIGQAQGCGQSRMLSVEYLFMPDGQIRRIGLLPGTTNADVTLQRDAMMYAMLGMARLAPKDCKDVRYTDTRFIAFQGEGPGRHPWTEEWTVRSCGVTGIVTMHFTPDAAGPGTTIQTSANETRAAGP